MKSQVSEIEAVQDIFSSEEKDTPWRLPTVLVDIIVKYFIYSPFKLWEDIFKEGETKPYKFLHDLKIIEHFKATFLAALSAMSTPKDSITLNLYHDHDRDPSVHPYKDIMTFDNSCRALEFLLIAGVNRKAEAHIFSPRRNMYNLKEHLDNANLHGAHILECLKDLLLMLWDSSDEYNLHEYHLNETGLLILKDFLKIKKSTDFEPILTKLIKDKEPPIYYFYPDEKKVSIVTVKKHYEVRRILDQILQYKDDADKWSKRQNEQYERVIAILQILNLLPQTVNSIISEYNNDKTWLFSLAASLSDQLQKLITKYSSQFNSLK